MRKSAFCICENKDADQLRGDREADQRLCFRYIDSTIPLLSKIRNLKLLATLCGCTARFVWDLVGNPEYRFSHNEANISANVFITLTRLYIILRFLFSCKNNNFQLKNLIFVSYFLLKT